MKKVFGGKWLAIRIFLALITVNFTIALTGCGSDNTIKVGTIKYLNVTEDALIKSFDETDKRGLFSTVYEQIFFDNINSMILALESKQIDELSTYETVAIYLSKKNPDWEWDFVQPIIKDVFCCAMREEDTDLKREFDSAILSMTADDTLTKLVKKYISDAEDTLGATELPTFYGAPMIKVGVTGDLPILDYIRSDNVPAGFNTAILAEISKRIGKNFVLVQVESGSRAIALTSGEVDVIFWVVAPNDDRNLPYDFDKPDGIILTEPYFSDEIVHVKLKK